MQSVEHLGNQGNIFSKYKNRPTVKVLIGVNPHGGAVFISDGFEGCISDSAITEKSGFLDFIEPGDVVCADRGFHIENLLVEKGATLIIPPHLGSQKALSLDEEGETRVISKARIHIERFNERMKAYKFLNGPVSQMKVNILSQAIFVIGCLANFSRLLVEK